MLYHDEYKRDHILSPLFSYIRLSFAVTEDGKDSGHASWEATMNEGLEATKIAGNALNALSPIDDDAVDDEQLNHKKENDVNGIDDDDEELLS